MPAPTLGDWATHSPYSDPAAHTDLLRAIAPEPATIRAAAMETVVHYCADPNRELTADQWHDIDHRWLSALLDTAVERSPGPLHARRAPEQQVAGCCRDHSLFAIGVLRSHGVPARSRVGFARYFEADRALDHVVVEYWNGERWIRWDPELAPETDREFDPFDMPRRFTHDPASDIDQPFPSAAQVWLAIRAGVTDPRRFTLTGAPGISGHDTARRYVLLEVAHRHRDEMLLWDLWGPMGATPAGISDTHPELAAAQEALAAALPAAKLPPAEYDALADELAHLLVAADMGDDVAAEELAELYHGDSRLRPGTRVGTLSPSRRGGITDLATRTTSWRPLAAS